MHNGICENAKNDAPDIRGNGKGVEQMADTIRIDTEALKDISAQIGRIRSSLESIAGDVSRSVTEVRRVASGHRQNGENAEEYRRHGKTRGKACPSPVRFSPAVGAGGTFHHEQPVPGRRQPFRRRRRAGKDRKSRFQSGQRPQKIRQRSGKPPI